MYGGLYIPNTNPTNRLFRLLADGGDTAPPGNTSMRAMAGCVCTVPANALRIGDLLRIYVAVGKGNNTTGGDGIQIALYLGPNGNLTDTALGSFGNTLAAANRSGGFSIEYRIISNTTMRRQGGGDGFSSMSGQAQVARPAIDTIPNITTGFKMTLAAAMNSAGTADYCVVHDLRVYVER